LTTNDFKATEEGRSDKVYAKVVTLSCVGVLCVILIAGLWPLHAPKNQVSWLKNQNGLSFGHYGSMVSAGGFRDSGLEDGSSGSLEIWLEPSVAEGRRTILSFDGSGHLGTPFSLHQNKSGLRVERHNVDSYGTFRTAWFDVEGVFRQNKPVFVTVILEKQVTSVYLDGVLAKTSPILGVSTNNFTGRLVIGDSATAPDSWSGQILGVAVYHVQLTPVQVAQHYKSWMETRRPTLSADEAPFALYLFDERKGNIARNQLDPATGLTIPSRYFILHPGLFLTPWREYKPTWSYWLDVGINIAGFIPFGLCIVAYLSSVRRISRATATTIMLGFTVSLTIETLQAFLPMRSSGMTDLITNTLGTAIGVAFYRWSIMQGLLTKVKDYSVLSGEHPSGKKASGSIKVGAPA
jgi:VanZ family protein